MFKKISDRMNQPIPAWRALAGVAFASAYASISMALWAKQALEAQRLQLTRVRGW